MSVGGPITMPDEAWATAVFAFDLVALGLGCVGGAGIAGAPGSAGSAAWTDV